MRLEVTMPNGTTASEVRAWIAELRDGGRPEPKASKVAPKRLLATPGQTFAPAPDARATEAINGFERKGRRDGESIRQLMRQHHGVCG